MHFIKKNDYNTEEKSLLKEKEIYDKIVPERPNEINNLKNKIKYDKLTHYFKSEDEIPIPFNGSNRPLGLIKKINNEKNGEKFRSNLSETTRGKWKHKSERQKNK